jgi:hypothetical protein
MFSITTSITFAAKTNRFKKFGKKMKKNSDADVGKIREKLSDISRDEQRRAKEIFKEHQEFFKGSLQEGGGRYRLLRELKANHRVHKTNPIAKGVSSN